MKHLELAGKQYTLDFTINSVCEAEERAGKPFSTLLNKEFSGVRWVLWCGLLERHPMTVKEVGVLMNEHIKAGGSFKALTEECISALTSSGFFGEAAEGADQEVLMPAT